MQKRWATAIQRLWRIGGLAVDLAGRGKFLANSAMATGTYGAGVAPTSATTAAWLRRWAMHAAWRGGHNAMPGLLFAAQYLPWRAVRAWFFLWDVLVVVGTREEVNLMQT